MTSGRCWPSTADEERYSPKSPSSSMAVNSSELNTKVSAFSLVHIEVYGMEESYRERWREETSRVPPMLEVMGRL